jgi:cation transport regulator ChaC
MAVPVNTYIPSQPGQFTQNFLDAREQTSSLMERKQRLAMAQEQQEMERAKFQAFMPAIIAKQNADMVSAAASIANATRMEQLRAKAAGSSTDYNDRFLNIMSIPDSKERSDTLGAFMGEIAWLDAVPEYKGFADAVKNERAKSFTEASANLKLDQHLEELTQTNENRRVLEQMKSGARIETAQIRANAPTPVQKIADALAAAKENGDDEEVLSGLRNALDKASTRADRISVVEKAISNRDAALKLGDRARAQVFQDEINKATSFASDPINNPLPSSSGKASANEQPFKEMKLPSGGKILIREQAKPAK